MTMMTVNATSAAAMDSWTVTSWETPAGISQEKLTDAPAAEGQAMPPTAHFGETNS